MVEVCDLEYGLKCVAAGGNVLNCQEVTCLQAGLNVLRGAEKCSEVYFWGKLMGSGIGGEQAKGPCDYFIAYALSKPEFEFPAKRFFYAGEDFVFKPLPLITDEIAAKIQELGLETPLTGVPERVVEPTAAEADEAADPPADEEGVEKPAKLTEADVLAQIIQEIDYDTAVVPKGSYALNEEHNVVPSSDFRGLSLSEATSQSKYVHFRPPTSVAALRALARTDIQFYSDFLDPIEGDLPKGCWVARQEHVSGAVTLRSLMWPGYIAYSVPGSTRFGGLYFGYGQRNQDLPFIL